MKKLVFVILSVLATSCHHGIIDRQAVETSIRRQMTEFPESRLPDLYKSFFQGRFGPGHLVTDRESALNYVLFETQQEDYLPLASTEPCGWEANYVRVNLSLVRDGIVSAEELTDALIASAVPVTDSQVESWKKEWGEILNVIQKTCPDIPCLDADAKKLDSLLQSGQYAYHHSDAYREAYHPHYRIIKKGLADRLIKSKNMQRVRDFLHSTQVYFLATVDGDQPQVRPFGTAEVIEDKLYIQTGHVKNVARQIAANPKVAICAYNGSEWLRITATLVEDPRVEIKKAMLDANPGLRSMYDENDDNTAVYFLKDAKATISSFTAAPIEIDF